MLMNEFTIAQRTAIADALASNYGKPSKRTIIEYVNRNLSSVTQEFGVGSKAQILKAYFKTVSDEEVLKSVQFFLAPELFIDYEEEYNEYRKRVNTALAFVGYEIKLNGKLEKVVKSETLTEAQRRSASLIAQVQSRKMHPKILEYCRAELFENDYYDVVFESIKGIYDTIRKLSGTTSDGAQLLADVFAIKTPMLLINDLKNESEESAHKGFSSLLLGLYGHFRNPVAHEVKIKWRASEVEVLEILGIVSYVYRVLDNVTKTCYAK